MLAIILPTNFLKFRNSSYRVYISLILFQNLHKMSLKFNKNFLQFYTNFLFEIFVSYETLVFLFAHDGILTIKKLRFSTYGV